MVKNGTEWNYYYDVEPDFYTPIVILVGEREVECEYVQSGNSGFYVRNDERGTFWVDDSTFWREGYK